MKSDRKQYGSVKNGKYIREKAAEDPADTNIPSDKSTERQPDKGSDKPADKSSDKLSDKQSGNRSAEGDPSQHARDVNSRRIFKNAKLTCQFLKEYSGLEIFAELQPEDIEDVTSKYQAYLGVEFESDIIKKIRIRTGEEEKEIEVRSLYE